MKEKITAVIIDDEPGNIITLTELLKEYCPDVMLLGSAPNPKVGYELIKKENPQLLFLDVEMPYGNAFDLLDRLSPLDCEVIFITAFNTYAVKAFRYAALDYLLKPVNIEELKASVAKAVARLEEKNIDGRIANLLSNLKQENPGIQKIALPTTEGLSFESIENIVYLQAEGSYTRAHLRGNKNILVTKNLKEYEDILPEKIFCRVHHSYIINLNLVKKYYRGRGGYVELEDGTSVEISARKKDEFLERFGQ